MVYDVPCTDGGQCASGGTHVGVGRGRQHVRQLRGRGRPLRRLAIAVISRPAAFSPACPRVALTTATGHSTVNAVIPAAQLIGSQHVRPSCDWDHLCSGSAAARSILRPVRHETSAPCCAQPAFEPTACLACALSPSVLKHRHSLTSTVLLPIHSLGLRHFWRRLRQEVTL